MPKPPKQHGTAWTSSAARPQSRLLWVLLVLAIALPVLSWVVASRTHVAVSSSGERRVAHGSPGPWGAIEYIPISIELPDHFAEVGESPPPQWRFLGCSQEQVSQLLRSSGIEPLQLEILMHRTKWEVNADGCVLYPGDDLVWGLSPSVRAAIYGALAEFEENIDQYYAFAYRPERLAERLENSGLQQGTLEMFRQLLYPDGNLLRFADTDIVLRKLKDARERLRLVKTVARRGSLLLKLCVRPGTDIDALVNYWGIGGRAKDLRPLLESLARVPEGCKLDIAHLLPPFARQRIYTYPARPENDEEPATKQDCHWTSLNFFKEQPSDGFTGPEQVASELEQNYVQVGEGTAHARFGDVLLLKNTRDIIVHSAVYIADDIVFTKNGAGFNQPWIYMKIEDMLPYYVTPKESLRILVYRKSAMVE